MRLYRQERMLQWGSQCVCSQWGNLQQLLQTRQGSVSGLKNQSIMTKFMFLQSSLISEIFGNFWQFSRLKFEENLPIFCSLPIQTFLDFGREASQFLNFSVLEGLVSYKPVSYKMCMG